jgi:hypothetical protein
MKCTRALTFKNLLQADARALMKGGTGMRWSRSLLLLNWSLLTLASLHRVWPHDASGQRAGGVSGGWSGEREAEAVRVPVGGAGRKAVVVGGGRGVAAGADKQGKCSKFFGDGAAISARAPSAEAGDPACGMGTGHRAAASSSSASRASSLLAKMPGFSSSALGAHRGGGGEGAGGGVGREGRGGPVGLGLHVSAAPGRGGGERESVLSPLSVANPLSVGTQGHGSTRGPGAGVSGGLSVAAKPLPSIPKKKQPSAVAVTVEKSGGSFAGVGNKQAPNGEIFKNNAQEVFYNSPPAPN